MWVRVRPSEMVRVRMGVSAEGEGEGEGEGEQYYDDLPGYLSQ